MKSDLNDFFSLLKQRPIMNKDEVYDFYTETIINIFENRQKFSNETCQELQKLVDKNNLGKKRCKLINETYEKFRLNKPNVTMISQIKLSQLLNNILLKDYQVKFNS